ncbi:MAG: hypothetical protein DHS20C13_14380 [Thermodesulfobacteriota bacterium]|nr:MAG: hypothetical protein DHS20C13_14380 [Thermodesulfobacteriota bacterium]
MVHKVYRVFLASPSDVNQEREIAKIVVADINKSIGRKFNITLDLVGWEDIPSGYGRPQGKINPHLEKSNLFIGLLWRTLGSPSGKETLTGFEEEFQLACERKEKKKIDDVKLFFRDIDEEFLKDPGEHLQSLLDFKEDIETNKKIYYEKFVDDHEWESKLRTNLTQYLLQKIEVGETQPTSSPVQATTSETPDGLNETKSHEDEEQVVESLNKTLKFLLGGDELDNYTTVRLFLYSSGLFYGNNLTSEVLKTHEIQQIYTFRKDIKLIGQEKILILRTIIEDKNNVTAGWFFLKPVNQEKLETLFFMLSINNFSENLRLQALDYILKLSNFSQLDKIVESFEGSSKNKQIAILQILSKHGNIDSIPILDFIIKSSHSPKIIKSAWKSKLKLLLNDNENSAIQLILDTNLDIRAELNEFLEDLLKLRDKSLLKGLSDDVDSNLRLEIINLIPELYTLEELNKILKYSLENESLLSSGSLNNYYKIRATALLELVKRGEVADLDFIHEKLLNKESSETTKTGILPDYSKIQKDEYIDSVLLELYKRQSYNELNQEIDWYNSEEQLKYQSLIEKHYDNFKETLYEDILNDFIRIKEDELRRRIQVRDNFINSYSDKDVEIKAEFKKQLDELDRFDEYIKTAYLKIALLGLSNIKRTLPIDLARKVLHKNMGFFRNQIMFNLLDSFFENGTTDDIKNIRNLIDGDKLSDNIEIKACKVLIKLDKENKEKTLEFLLDTNNPVLLKTLFSIMPITPKDSVLDKIKLLLYNERDTVREVTLSYLFQIMDDDELAELLENYSTKNNTYYYNVVCWLDRYLFAPAELKEHFREELKAKLA